MKWQSPEVIPRKGLNMKPYSMDLRIRVIRLVKMGGLTKSEIAALFGVSLRWVQKLTRQWRETNDIAPKPQRRNPRIVISLEKLKEYVTQHPDATLEEMKQGCGLSVSTAAICKALKRLGFSRKKKVIRAVERDRPDVQSEQRQWKHKTCQVSTNRMIFIDQTGISTQMHRTHGRAPIGERVIGVIPENHYHTSTLMGALRVNGQFESLVYKGGTDIPAVLTFIDSQLRPILKPGDIVVWDNLPTHHAVAVTTAIERMGAKVWHLPPYSPELNPIEKLWSKLKTFLRGVGARTPETLLNALQDALQTITTLNIRHWFKHCGYANT